MSDLSDTVTPVPNKRAGDVHRKGLPAGRLCSVVFFIVSVCVFFGGLFYWLQKRQETRDASASAKVCATPEVLGSDLFVALKDRVDYSFWPPYYMPVLEHQGVLRQCLQVAQQYLASANVVDKSSFVWDSLEMLPLMVRHYSAAGPELMLSKPTGPKGFTLLEVEGKPCAQVLIGFKATPDMEFCFFKDDKEGVWKLDWPQFARYQPENWEEFVRGVGPDMAEFRVWMIRDRTSEDRDHYVYQLIAPGRNGTDDRSIARPMVSVSKKSEIGKRLFMLFRINEEMLHSPYRVLAVNDDKDALRVRVVLSRSEASNRKGEYSFTIVRLLGEGWYGLPSSSSPSK